MKSIVVPIDAAMREKIQELGKFWKKSETNPKISEKVLSKWERLIDDWINDETLPIIIRKQT